MIDFDSDPRYQDIEPLQPLDEDILQYSPYYKRLSGYFRYLRGIHEISERSYEVCKEMISQASANYVAWGFLRELILGLNISIEQQTKLVDDVVKGFARSYQLWNHRQWMVKNFRCHEAELVITAQILSNDQKNYHCWSHRQWVITYMKENNLADANFIDQELTYSMDMIEQDFFNNSAFNHRYFMLNLFNYNNIEFIHTELRFISVLLCDYCENESAVTYVRSLMELNKEAFYDFDIGVFEKIYQENFDKRCFYYFEFMMDLFIIKGRNQEAKAVCEKLIDEDKTKSNFWKQLIDFK
eukprot:TRINITY_DN3131_c1_g1_i1.p1 TRINITY_DN3131_c1_g1~~TRINITY_DN3131_c1_g1_i1.p1  ORF type:complete len:298 (+),score=73.30 TRINITY_DN3131_c1_g1_i1:464-1357(+)